MRILSAVSIILTIFFTQVNCFAKETVESRVFKLIKQRDWSSAYSLSSKANNPALKKVVLSEQFLDTNYKGNSFEKIVQFLQENPCWPREAALRVSAENLLSDATNSTIIFKWFENNKPITGRGCKYYAIAAGKLVKDPKKLAPIIKTGWQKGSFSLPEQKSYHTKFKNYLDLNDHIKRIDNLLFAESVTAAKNNLYLVGSDYKKSFEVQIALIQHGDAALGKFKTVPPKYYTNGLIYRYINLKKKNLPPSSEIVNLVSLAQSDPDNADRFWKVQSYLAREYIENKRYSDAYKIVCCHFTENAANKSDAEFLAGWLALRFLNKPQLALGHFQSFDNVVKTPMSKSRGIYWLARTYEALKDKDKAQKLYNLAATKYPYTFYGQVSASELGMTKISLPSDINLQKHKTTLASKPNRAHIAKATHLVSRYGSNALSEVYIKAAVEKAEDTTDIMELAALLSTDANIHHMAWLSKYATQKRVLIKNYAFPTPYKIAHLPLEKSLIYSIIRQESVFDQHAISSADARGLMQLVKATACDTAKLVGDKCVISRLTSDPSYNIKLGSNHFKYLAQKFAGSYILAIAAYNGGCVNVNKWLKIYGDPRTMANLRDVLDWIESIPFYETRNYVQRVLENLQIYRIILNENNNSGIIRDLVL